MPYMMRPNTIPKLKASPASVTAAELMTKISIPQDKNTRTNILAIQSWMLLLLLYVCSISKHAVIPIPSNNTIQYCIL